MRGIRPIIVMNENGVEALQVKTVLDAISEVCEIAGVSQEIQISHVGCGDRANISEASHIDYYLKNAKVNYRGYQVNADDIINLIDEEISKIFPPIYYKVLILKTDLYGYDDNGEELHYCIGNAKSCYGALISTARFLDLSSNEQLECIKTETIHELGHVFGLIPDSRKIMVEKNLGKHCKNCCTMRQGLNVPDDWKRISNDRLKCGTFCDICQKDLRSYFFD